MKFVKARNSGIPYSQFQAEGRWLSTEVHNFLPESALKSSYEYLQATIPWTSHTEKFKNWKKSGVIKGNKHSPF